ncbi:3'-5' exonuclease [Paraliomyxa miuraensis]|nr:3'-5' exonuclease [Paraliomyxa miuraensis]
MSTTLAMLDVLVVDGQSTGASPAHGHLLELGWARTRASASESDLEVHSRLLALPEGATIPRPVIRLTGIEPRLLAGAVEPARAWSELRAAATSEGVSHAVVIHFSRFELPFLRGLHEHADPGEDFPLRPPWCTHEIARRLLPGLPRRGLRALAGYFGYGVDELKRSAEHVRATAFVWRHLVGLLHAEQGVSTPEALEQWLSRPPPPREAKRSYPMPRALRLALPDEPGMRLLVFERGVVSAREDRPSGTRSPLPPGWTRPLHERRLQIDAATFDRLRTLTTEVRRVAADGRIVELVLGPRRRLRGDRLQRALAWV